ncbi:MAG: K+-dependent Na+/Ca+ exchanger related-protein, partial [Microgenomates bacterium 39_6]
MLLNQFAVFFLFVLFFSWSLFLLISPKKREQVSLESGLFLLMIAPEVFLILLLAFSSWGEAALGLIMGVNLISFLLIPGLVAIFKNKVKVKVKNLRLDFLAVFLITALPLIFLKDFQLSKGEGLSLLMVGAVLFGWRWRLPVLVYKTVTKRRPEVNWQMILGFLLSIIFFLLSLLALFSLEINLSLF